MYSADASGTQYVWDKVPAEEGDFVLYTDAQATIATLQAERDTARRRVDELEAREVDAVMLREDLEQRTAELEAIEKILDINSGKTTVEKVRDLHHSFKQVWESYQDASNEMFKAQAELERVRGELQSAEAGYFVAERDLQGMNNRYDDLRALIAALPKVEGEITANRVCTIMMHGLYCEEFTKLLQHRQGME